MTAVSATDGIAYGLKATLSFGFVLLIALVFAIAGTNMATGSVLYTYDGWEVMQWGRLLVGLALSVVGLVALYGGTFGLLYKVVADGIDRGTRRTA
ncbi:hypothetical protein ACFQMA_13355 [Halosimplex aquaticum]|uniref:Uncharacterized protein n=1 Tax=Halosimplex aquaticum TaxID=3026162 RepID=A0ABD5Y093_9EURY|nr:hypothetical protein [Halosimplex aquaticum]